MKNDNKRLENLRELLVRLRDEMTARVKSIRQEQDGDALTSPGDVMDVAKSLADEETHTSLLERAQTQLRQIDNALGQLERGDYGICANCGDEIPLARLQAIPFATYCVECQEKVQRGAPGQADVRAAAYKQWTPPVETDEGSAVSDEGNNTADEVNVRQGTAFGPEEEEIDEDAPPELEEPTGGRRGRPAKKRS
jgi:DnaK suppressor protein